MKKQKFYIPAIDADENSAVIIGEGYLQGTTAQGHFVDYVGHQCLVGADDMWEGEHTFPNVCLTMAEAQNMILFWIEEMRMEEVE